MENDAVIIEVALNEAVSPAIHPAVPQSAEACAADARRCADSGAAIVHWHAVDPTGSQRLGDAALYGTALDAMDGCILAYPSYPVNVPDTVDERLGHCFTLREHHGLELGPIDAATVNLVFQDESTGMLGPLEDTDGQEVIRNSLPFVCEALRRFDAVGLVPTMASFDVGSTRTIGALAEAGTISQPVMIKIFLWGRPLIGPEPSVEALDLHLRQLPPSVDVEWLVVPHGIRDPRSVEELSLAALERGGGVRIGIGDTPTAFADAPNPQLVERAAQWAEAAGRPIASVADVRARFGCTRTVPSE
jgi:3-keto-5-aminohexanoate cleavage enzyme